MLPQLGLGGSKLNGWKWVDQMFWVVVITYSAVVLTLSEVARRQADSLWAGLVTLAAGAIAGYVVFIVIVFMSFG